MKIIKKLAPWIPLLVTGFVNTTYPQTGASNAFIALVLIAIGLSVFHAGEFVLRVTVLFLGFTIFAALGLHGVNSRDLSSALAIALTVTYVLSPLNQNNDSRSNTRRLFGFFKSEVLRTGLYTIIIIAGAEYFLAFVDGGYTALSQFPRSSAPLRFDGFGFGGVAGGAYDPNNLAGVIAILIYGSVDIISSRSLFLNGLIGVVCTGSRTLLLTFGVLSLKRSVRWILLSAVILIFVGEGGCSIVSELYSGRLDTRGETEGSFVGRFNIISENIKKVSILPPPDTEWIVNDGSAVYLSSYNLYLTIALRFGMVPCVWLLYFFVRMLILAPKMRGLMVGVFLFNLTGEFLLNYFCLYTLCVVVLCLRRGE